MVTLIGCGCGSLAGLTEEAKEALKGADQIIGAGRLLENLPEHCAALTGEYRPAEILNRIREAGEQEICVVYSGDTGFYSGAKKLAALLREAEIPHRILPGLSSIQRFAALLETPWQDWRLCSAHGVECDVVYEVCRGKDTFFLTGGKDSPQDLCRRLNEAGLGFLKAAVGEDLSYPDERIVRGTAEEFAQMTFAPLSVLLVEAAPAAERRVPGIPDEAFIRTTVPMTKQEVRCAVLSKLAVRETDVCWDVGAGTGSVSVELALHSRQVWAVERKPEAAVLIRENRKKFGAWNLQVVEGAAPEALAELPAPDVVFIGGSSGELGAIVECVRAANPYARICISAIALETLQSACSCFEELGIEAEVTQIAVSRTKGVGGLHLLMAQNPIFLITGELK